MPVSAVMGGPLIGIAIPKIVGWYSTITEMLLRTTRTVKVVLMCDQPFYGNKWYCGSFVRSCKLGAEIIQATAAIQKI